MAYEGEMGRSEITTIDLLILMKLLRIISVENVSFDDLHSFLDRCALYD